MFLLKLFECVLIGHILIYQVSGDSATSGLRNDDASLTADISQDGAIDFNNQIERPVTSNEIFIDSVATNSTETILRDKEVDKEENNGNQRESGETKPDVLNQTSFSETTDNSSGLLLTLLKRFPRDADDEVDVDGEYEVGLEADVFSRSNDWDTGEWYEDVGIGEVNTGGTEGDIQVQFRPESTIGFNFDNVDEIVDTPDIGLTGRIMGMGDFVRRYLRINRGQSGDGSNEREDRTNFIRDSFHNMVSRGDYPGEEYVSGLHVPRVVESAVSRGSSLRNLIRNPFSPSDEVKIITSPYRVRFQIHGRGHRCDDPEVYVIDDKNNVVKFCDLSVTKQNCALEEGLETRQIYIGYPCKIKLEEDKTDAVEVLVMKAVLNSLISDYIDRLMCTGIGTRFATLFYNRLLP